MLWLPLPRWLKRDFTWLKPEGRRNENIAGVEMEPLSSLLQEPPGVKPILDILASSIVRYDFSIKLIKKLATDPGWKVILNESDPGHPSGCRRLVTGCYYSVSEDPPRRERQQFSPFLQIPAGSETPQSLTTSPSHYSSVVLQTLFCSTGLVASSQTFEFSYFSWLLVGGHDDFANGPHKSATVLLGNLLFLSLFYPFVPLRLNSLY